MRPVPRRLAGTRQRTIIIPPDAGFEDPAADALRVWDLEYRLGASDEIVAVGGAWHDFAAANDGAAVAEARVVGHSIWTFVAGAEARSLYRRIYARARSGRRLRFPIRCDSPSSRRVLEMEVAMDASDLRIRTRTLIDEPREYTPMLAPGAPRSEEFLSICGWCSRVRLDD
ncbi:MAG: hypothetical protein AB7N90_11045, partial [Vicinamibacterales bacterium]